MPRHDPDNPYVKKPHRAALKEKSEIKPEERQQAEAPRLGRSFARRYNGITGVVCQQIGLRYREVDAPRNFAELRDATDPAPTEEVNRRRLFARTSWEVLTEQR